MVKMLKKMNFLIVSKTMKATKLPMILRVTLCIKRCAVPILFFIFIYSCTQSTEHVALPEFFEGYLNVKTFEPIENPNVSFSFVKEKVFADSEDIYLSNSDNIGVGDSNKVFIENHRSIDVYENNGDYKGSIGREGRCPGEFQTIHNFKLRNGKLYVFDANQSKVSIFDTATFELTHEIDIPIIDGMRGMGDFAVMDDDFLNVGMRETKREANSVITQRYLHFFLIDYSGHIDEMPLKIADISDYYEIANQRGASYPPIPFDRTTLFSVSSIGNIYFLWTDQVAIKVLDSKGNFLNGIFYPYSNVHVKNDSAFPVFYDTLGLSISDTRQILGEKLPDSHPAVSHFFVDDEERLWMSTITDDENVYEWWVLEETGEFITKFEWQRDELIEVIKNGKMYTRQTDEETGLQHVVRYGVELREIE